MFKITLKFTEKDKEKILKAFSEKPNEFNDIRKIRTDIYIKALKQLRKAIKNKITKEK